MVFAWKAPHFVANAAVKTEEDALEHSWLQHATRRIRTG
jgi:hypothetical protein